MKKLVVLLMVALMATSAFATIDPDSNMLGVYFDGAAADINCKVLPGFVYSYAYVVLTTPSLSSIDGFEFSYNLDYIYTGDGSDGGTGVIGDDFARTVNTIPTGGLNIGNAGDLASGEYVVGIASPLATTGNTILVTWRFRCFADDWRLNFYLGPTSVPSLPGGVAAVTAGGTLYPLGFSTGGAQFPVASFNGDCPVAVEQTTFGGVKSLFR